MCVCPSSLGVSIQWEANAYTVSEDSGTVHLVLLKEGSTEINASVEVVTVAGNASGEIHRSNMLTGFKICNNHWLP